MDSLLKIDPWYIAMALLSGMIGMGAAMYGKKMNDFKSIIIGTLLMGIAYFITNPILLTIATVILTAGLFSTPIQRYLSERKNIESIE